MNQKKTPRIFYVILILIPVLFFVLIEIGLRLAGYGRNYELFTEIEGAPPGMIYLNPEISYKYFGDLENSVFSQAIGMRKKKPENGFRIFVFGGSSAQGFPYARNASFPSHLERKLQYTFPDKIIEVVNLGTSAINSHTLLDILPDVLDHSPDLILMYAGHNEYYGALGPASTRLGNPNFVRILLKLREYRLVQLLQNMLSSSQKSSDTNKNLMQNMIGQSSIEWGGDIYTKGIKQFDNNLSDFIETVQKDNIPFIIGTLSSNIKDHPPFNSDQKDEKGYTSKMYFELGNQSYQSGDYKEAKVQFVRAKEMDGLRFRAPEQMNELIKNKARNYQLPLVDIDSIFSANSPGGITGDSLMCDHLHPSREGYFLMANAYFNKLAETNYLPGNPTAAWPSDSLLLAKFPYSSLDSLFDRRMLLSGLGQYPFVPLGSPNPYEEEIRNDGIDYEISSRSQVDSIRSIVAVEKLMEGDIIAFEKEMEVMLSYMPLSETAYLRTINALTEAGLLAQAYPLLYSKIRQLDPGRSKHKMLGLYFMNVLQHDSAIYHFEKALEIAEAKDYLQLNLGKAYGMQQKFNRAIEQFTRVIELDPTNKEAYNLRGGANFELKKFEETVKDMSEVIRLSNQSDAIAFMIRGYAKISLNDTKGACEDWLTASKLGSPQAVALAQQYCQ
ncbi:SGNH/GDSL hydrolase family protein [Ekhidna sp.]|uniref:SGNH/GDSL hydrolase family protein n=1 Tax=Ekhidna sp. TaxID=2608089 RepID=UPI003BAB4516